MQQDYELRNAAMPHHLRRKTLIWYAMICYPSSKPLNPQLLTEPPSFPPTLELFSSTSKRNTNSPSIHQDSPTFILTPPPALFCLRNAFRSPPTPHFSLSHSATLNPQSLTEPSLALLTNLQKQTDLPQFTRNSQQHSILIHFACPLLPTKRTPTTPLALSLLQMNRQSALDLSILSTHFSRQLPTCATNSNPPKAHLHFLSFSLAIRQWGVTTTPENFKRWLTSRIRHSS